MAVIRYLGPVPTGGIRTDLLRSTPKTAPRAWLTFYSKTYRSSLMTAPLP